MQLPPFKLECYFARYEFNVKYLLCSSDCESLEVKDLLALEPQAQERFQRHWLGYTESLGASGLRQEIARIYTTLQSEEILVHSGAEEAIFLFMHAALNPGDHVIVHSPCYQSLVEVARGLGCDVALWEAREQDAWALHLEVAISAAEAGCHILLEKPVSHSMERTNALQAALRRGCGRVLVGYQFRFHPGLQKVASLLSAGAIGRPLSVCAHWGEYLPGWHPWEDYRQGYSARANLGGGVVLTLSHPLDYLRWLLGEVESVWAFTGRLSDLELDVEDSAEIGLRFTRGILGSFHLDYNQQPPEHHLEITGTRGTLRWDNADGAVALYLAPPASAGKPGQEKWQSFPIPVTGGESKNIERNDLFLAEMPLLAGDTGRGPACVYVTGWPASSTPRRGCSSICSGWMPGLVPG